VLVLKVDAATLSVESVLVENTDYTISGSGTAITGAVTLTSALTSTYKLVIMRSMDFLQQTAFTETGPFTMSMINGALDKLGQELLQVKDVTDRSIQLPRAIGSGYDPMLPKPVPSMMIGTDSLGTGLQYYPVTTVYSAQIDDISNYGNSLATLVATVGATRKLVHVGTSIPVDGNVTVPSTLVLWIPEGGELATASGVKVRFYSPENVIAGLHQIFRGDGTDPVEFQTAGTVYVEWWGAVADGDGATDDVPAFLSCIASLAQRSTMISRSVDDDYAYWIDNATLVFGTMADNATTSRMITWKGSGEAKSPVHFNNTGTAVSVYGRSHNFSNLAFSPSTAVVRNNINQHGIYFSNSTGSRFKNIRVAGFYNNFSVIADRLNGVAPKYMEVNTFENITLLDGIRGWNLDVIKALETNQFTSFATNRWTQCTVDIANTISDAIGVYIGETIDVYRSYMDIAVSPQGENNIGFYYNGNSGLGFTGRWTVECHNSAAGVSTGTGIYIGEHGHNLSGDIFTSVVSCATPYDRHSSGAKVRGMYRQTNAGRVDIVWPDTKLIYKKWSTAGMYDRAQHATSGTHGATTTITIPNHTLYPHDDIVIRELDEANPFYEYLEGRIFEVLSVPDANSITIDVNTDDCTDPCTWTPGDNGTVKAGYVQYIERLSSDNRNQRLSPYRFEFKDSTDDTLFQMLTGVLALTCKTAVDGNSTPDVKGCPCLELSNASATTITDFLTPGADDRLLMVRHTNANTTISNNANIVLLNQQDTVGSANMYHIFAVSSGVWYEVVRRSPSTVIPQYKYASPSGSCSTRGAVQFDDNATYICTGASLVWKKVTVAP